MKLELEVLFESLSLVWVLNQDVELKILISFFTRIFFFIAHIMSKTVIHPPTLCHWTSLNGILIQFASQCIQNCYHELYIEKVLQW